MARILNLIKWTTADGSVIDLKTWLYRNVFLSWLSPINASLAFAITYILLWLIPMTILYRKKIFIKV